MRRAAAENHRSLQTLRLRGRGRVDCTSWYRKRIECPLCCLCLLSFRPIELCLDVLRFQTLALKSMFAPVRRLASAAAILRRLAAAASQQQKAGFPLTCWVATWHGVTLDVDWRIASGQVSEPSNRDPESRPSVARGSGSCRCLSSAHGTQRLVLSAVEACRGFDAKVSAPHCGNPGAATHGEAELTVRSAVLQLVSTAKCSRPSRPHTPAARPHRSSPSMPSM